MSQHLWMANEESRARASAKALVLNEPARMPRLGRFALVRLLGRGAHGAVYQATDPQTNEVVALKILRAPDPTSIHRFKREFRALAGIAHENLVQLHELFVDEAEWYFTMELVAGTGFSAYVRASEGIPRTDESERLRNAFASLAAGVQAIHGAGKLHRDLKPSNVRVTENGRVVVLDYGLVSTGDTRNGIHDAPGAAGGAPSGTPEYMAPELFTRCAATTASDVYAMGVMMFSALTGRLPFAERTPSAFESEGRTAAPRVRTIAEHVPSDLDALCTAMLSPDPSCRPTLEEVQQILTGHRCARSGGAILPGGGARFVGREAEVRALYAALEDTRSGRPVAVFLNGISGIGKSALVEHFSKAIGGYAIVLEGRCYEREAVPYKGFDGIIDSLVRYLRALPASAVADLVPGHVQALGQVFPALKRVAALDSVTREVAPVDHQELRQQSFVALKALLYALSRQHPLVLVADDLQWADLDSARLLLELLGPPSAPPFLYIGCYRTEDEASSEFLKELLAPQVARGQWQRRAVTLGPLAEPDSLRLALRLLSNRLPNATQTAERIAQEAAGVPFFVRELAHHAAMKRGQDGAVSVERLLGDRIATLPAGARRVLELLALAARPVPEPVIAHALDEREPWRRGLRILELAGLMRRDAGGSLVAYHDRVREPVAACMSSIHRAAMHGILAAAYEASGVAEPDWLIEHWRAAGEPAKALECAIRAASSAGQKLAFNRAAALYRTSLDLIDSNDSRRGDLFLQLGEALANAGRAGEAGEALLAAAATESPGPAWSLRCRAAQQLLRSQNARAAKPLIKQLLSEVGLQYPRGKGGLAMGLVWSRLRLAKENAFHARKECGTTCRRRVEVLRAMFREHSIVDPLRGLVLQNQFYAEALRSGDPEAIFVGLAWDTYYRSLWRGRRGSRRNVKALARLEQMAANLGSPYASATVSLMQAVTAQYEGRYRDVASPAARGQEIFGERCAGALWEQSICTTLRYTALEICGPIRVLCNEVPALQRRADERGDEFSGPSITVALALALLANDEHSRAIEFMRERCARVPARAALVEFLFNNRLVDCLRYAGNALAAFRHWDECCRRYRRNLDRLQLARVVIHHQRARCAVSATAQRWDDDLARIADAEAQLVLGMRRPESPVVLASIRAALAWQRGDRAGAQSKLAEAIVASIDAGLLAYTPCYQRHLGAITGGPEGERMVAQADAELRGQGVVNPARWAEVYAAGFGGASPA